jgi:ADP-ribosyl-[dinitrogen reductase] hydrolase
MSFKPEFTTDSLVNKALGAYLGFACGDALGATVEFMYPKKIQQQYGVHGTIIGGGWLNLNKGDVTDDTEMSIALGNALISQQAWDIHAVANNFVAWLDSFPADVGDTCRRGISRYKTTGELYGPVSDKDAGNGACMRILPLVLASLNTTHFDSWVLQQNHITHNNPVADQASLTLGHMTKYLLTGREELVQGEIDHLLTLYPDFQYQPYPGRASAYIVYTMQTVLHFFETTDNFEDCVVQTVNMGSDADTTGAIVGMLAGAKYGLEAIPQRWLEALNPHVYDTIRTQTIELLKLAEILTDSE